MMTTIDDIEKAVTKLTLEQHAEFRAWFEAYDAQIFDEKIARDAEAGKLDRLAAKARENHKAGRRDEI